MNTLVKTFAVFFCTIFFSNFATAAQWRGNFVKFGGFSEIDSTQSYDNVVVVGGDLMFSGRAHDIVVLKGDIQMGASAVVDGSIVIVGGTIGWQDGAKVHGEVVKIKRPWDFDGLFELIGAALGIVGAISLAALAQAGLMGFFAVACLLFYFIHSHRAAAIVTTLRLHPLSSFGWGLGLLGGCTLMIAVCIASIMGVLFLPFIGIFGLFFLFYCLFISSMALGKSLGFFFRKPPLLLQYFAGFFLLSVIWVFIPHSTLLFLIFMIPIAGAILQTRHV